MRVTVIGVKRMSGVGKESGRSFDFAQIEVLRPLEQVNGKTFQLHGFGYETSKLDLAQEALEKFQMVKYPAVLDLSVDTVPGRQGLRSIVVGFRPADVKPLAA